MSHIIIDTEKEEDGRWIAEVTNVPGMMAYGETEEIAMLTVIEKLVRS